MQAVTDHTINVKMKREIWITSQEFDESNWFFYVSIDVNIVKKIVSFRLVGGNVIDHDAEATPDYNYHAFYRDVKSKRLYEKKWGYATANDSYMKFADNSLHL